MMLIDPFRSGVQGPATLEFKQVYPVTAGTAPTLTGVPIGAEAPARHVIVSAHWRYNPADPGAPFLPTGFSVNGNAGQVAIVGPDAILFQGSGIRSAIALAPAPSGATADITMTFNGLVVQVEFGVYVGTNIGSMSAIDTASGTGVDGGPITVNCDVQAEGVIIAAGETNTLVTPPSVIYSGITYRYESGVWNSGAGNITPATTTDTITVTGAFIGNGYVSTLIAASFR